jgi:hypothetical protein
MPLLTALSRQEVVANLRSISHTTRTSVPPKHEGVYRHQALPGMWEARLYGVPAAGRPKGAYQVSRAKAQMMGHAIISVKGSNILMEKHHQHHRQKAACACATSHSCTAPKTGTQLTLLDMVTASLLSAGYIDSG